jgi:transcriptional regulator with XRE-family HTH domain
MIYLGSKIKSLRLEKHLTQEQVAQRIGVSKAMISSYELSTRSPSYDILIKLSAFFKVSTDYLLGLEDSRTIQLSGLSDRQVEILNTLIDELKK